MNDAGLEQFQGNSSSSEMYSKVRYNKHLFVYRIFQRRDFVPWSGMKQIFTYESLFIFYISFLGITE